MHNAFREALYLVRWYVEEHVLLCLIPAFFIAGAIAVFVSQGARLGPAKAFLYSGPAINVLAIILTARILGMELGIGAVLFNAIRCAKSR